MDGKRKLWSKLCVWWEIDDREWHTGIKKITDWTFGKDFRWIIV